MKKLLHVPLVVAVAISLTTVWTSPAFADEALSLQAAEGSLGTVVTNQVTAPITIGGITYVPWETEGGSLAQFRGSVISSAVTAPVMMGGYLYVPPDWLG